MKRNWIKQAAALALSVLLLFTAGGAPETLAASPAGYYRRPYTDVNSAETVTVMVYIVGSDLEEDLGCATDDIVEMMNANIGQNVQVVLQTGGTNYWWNDTMEGGVSQRFLLRDYDVTLLENLGPCNMVSSDALADFIRFSAQNYPADRYQLVMWDHGGGTLAGFGYDESYPNATIDLAGLSDALQRGGVHFDFIGFDACLMATFEVAYVLEPYADYLIASEESEPASGWFYTPWLNLLEKYPNIPTAQLGRQIVNSYVRGSGLSPRDEPSLSVIDLTTVRALYSCVQTYMANATHALRQSRYNELTQARSQTREYGDGEYEQIDMMDFVRKTNLPGANDLMAALRRTVIYGDTMIPNTCGLAMYFPYKYPDYYQSVAQDMTRAGFPRDYFAYFDKALSIQAYGREDTQLPGYYNDSPFSLPSVENPQAYAWFDEEAADLYANNYQSLHTNTALQLDYSGSVPVLSLSETDWDSITDIAVQVWVDDGEGYIDLGLDNVYEFNDNMELLIDFDYSWVAISGTVVPYYVEKETSSEGYWYTYGYVPAELNHTEDIEIILRWDTDHPGGYVAGYRYLDNEPSVFYKGLRQFAEGDEIRYYCHYYDYDRQPQDDYYIGDPLVYHGENMTVSYLDIGDVSTEIYYVLRDVANNLYYTETVSLEHPDSIHKSANSQ